MSFGERILPGAPDDIAPDGLEVRVLAARKGGSMAHFTLAGGQVGRAVMHPEIEEIWYFLAGRGEFWRADAARDVVVPVVPGLCVTIPAGTRFQLRAEETVTAVAITMPPWEGPHQVQEVGGRWAPTV